MGSLDNRHSELPPCREVPGFYDDNRRNETNRDNAERAEGPCSCSQYDLQGFPCSRQESGSRCLQCWWWAYTAGRNQNAVPWDLRRGCAGAGACGLSSLPWSSQRKTGPSQRMWLGQKEAVGASSSCVTPQSPEKKEMAAYMSKRRDKEEKNRCFYSSGFGRGEERRSVQDTSKALLE